MNSIVKYIVKKDNSNINVLLSNVMFTTNEIKNIIQFILYLLHNNCITDENSFGFIYLIITNCFNFIVYDCVLDNINIIDNVTTYYKCLNHFKKDMSVIKKHELTHKIIKTYRDYSDVYLKLLIIMHNFDQTDGSIKKHLCSFTLKNFYKSVTKLLHYINRYKVCTFLKDVKWNNYYVCYDTVNINIKYMHDNLLHIISYIGKILLNYMGVPLIKNNEFDKMKYNKKIVYYNKCISSITKFLKHIILDYRKISKCNNKICMFHFIYKNINSINSS